MGSRGKQDFTIPKQHSISHEIVAAHQDIDRANLCCKKRRASGDVQMTLAFGGIRRGRQGCQVGISSILLFTFSMRRGSCSSARMVVMTA